MAPALPSSFGSHFPQLSRSATNLVPPTRPLPVLLPVLSCCHLVGASRTQTKTPPVLLVLTLAFQNYCSPLLFQLAHLDGGWPGVVSNWLYCQKTQHVSNSGRAYIYSTALLSTGMPFPSTRKLKCLHRGPFAPFGAATCGDSSFI